MAKKAGIVCPKCGANLRVYRTTPQEGFVRREKFCPDCHQPVLTDERPVDLAHPRGADRSALAADLVALIQRHGLADMIRRQL